MHGVPTAASPPRGRGGAGTVAVEHALATLLRGGPRRCRWRRRGPEVAQLVSAGWAVGGSSRIGAARTPLGAVVRARSSRPRGAWTDQAVRGRTTATSAAHRSVAAVVAGHVEWVGRDAGDGDGAVSASSRCSSPAAGRRGWVRVREVPRARVRSARIALRRGSRRRHHGSRGARRRALHAGVPTRGHADGETRRPDLSRTRLGYARCTAIGGRGRSPSADGSRRWALRLPRGRVPRRASTGGRPARVNRMRCDVRATRPDPDAEPSGTAKRRRQAPAARASDSVGSAMRAGTGAGARSRSRGRRGLRASLDARRGSGSGGLFGARREERQAHGFRRGKPMRATWRRACRQRCGGVAASREEQGLEVGWAAARQRRGGIGLR
jgi:hypothetical protein